jgi:hypothetical protein
VNDHEYLTDLEYEIDNSDHAFRSGKLVGSIRKKHLMHDPVSIESKNAGNEERCTLDGNHGVAMRRDITCARQQGGPWHDQQKINCKHMDPSASGIPECGFVGQIAKRWIEQVSQADAMDHRRGQQHGYDQNEQGPAKGVMRDGAFWSEKLDCADQESQDRSESICRRWPVLSVRRARWPTMRRREPCG